MSAPRASPAANRQDNSLSETGLRNASRRSKTRVALLRRRFDDVTKIPWPVSRSRAKAFETASTSANGAPALVQRFVGEFGILCPLSLQRTQPRICGVQA